MIPTVLVALAFGGIAGFLIGYGCGVEDSTKPTTAEMKRRQKVKVLKVFVARRPLSEEEWATKEYAAQLLERARKA